VLVFLTGATGFIGGRLAEALHARGCRLRCLVRSPARAARLQALGAELVVADVADESALERGLQDATLTYHVAGRYDLGTVDEAELEHVNVVGTRAFLGAVRRSAVRHAVYVSTTAALGPVESGEGDEHSEYHGPYPSVYHRTKTAAHHMAQAAQRDGLPLTIVCPAAVYGPGDQGPTGRYVQDLLRHRIPGLSTRPSWFSYAHVEDVVAGMVEAGARAEPGTFVLSGEHADANSYTAMIVRAAGTWGPPLRLPPAMVRATGILMDAAASRLGVRLPVSRELADVAGSGARWLHSHALATAELGYSPRPLAEGLPDTVQYAREQLSN
jgi:nucleoside-diphosphate-sugar epimerase